MKTFRERSVNKTFYILGLILAIPLFVLFILQNGKLFHFNLTKLFYPCIFYRFSGLYCPGCGGTRAVRALLEGHFISSLLYHPFVLYCFVLYIVFMGSHTLEWICSQKKSSHQKPFVRGLDFKISYVYIGIIIILLQWMIKNLFLLIHY